MISDLLLESHFEILLQSIHHTVITLANPGCLLLEKEIKQKLKLLVKNNKVKGINFVTIADPKHLFVECQHVHSFWNLFTSLWKDNNLPLVSLTNNDKI